jgi:hypothetical protein
MPVRGQSPQRDSFHLERLRRQEHRKARLFDAYGLDVAGEPLTDDVPDVHGCWAKDEEAGDLAVVLKHLCLEDHFLIPCRKVFALLDSDANDIVIFLPPATYPVAFFGALLEKICCSVAEVCTSTSA